MQSPDARQRKRCGSPLNGKPGTCRNWAMPNGRCRMHGGKSLGGTESPTYVDGRYSKYIPKRLRERYEESRDDSELLNMREEIALVDARKTELLERVDSGESGRLWADLRRMAHRIKRCRRRGETEEADALTEELFRLVETGYSDQAAWSEVMTLVARRDRLVSSERGRQLEAHQVLTTREATMLLTAVVEAVQRHVTDPREVAAISVEMGKIMGEGPEFQA